MKVQFMDTKRLGRVDLENIVLQETPEQEVRVEHYDLSKPRYLPETVPDSLFTKSELSRMGLVPLHDEVAYVRYPERDTNCFRLTRSETKEAVSSLLVNAVDSIEEVLKRRKNAIEVRNEQLRVLRTGGD